ncbi:hypothetical protein BKA61DRAFT_720448 [Leptodontidium sp. MPI-SDFR-AT-0119]|nr:hypothetical protein BKA61DRAFT_720448 [Leptodontidium sp. MPI-SDFR-AT-0119]
MCQTQTTTTYLRCKHKRTERQACHLPNCNLLTSRRVNQEVDAFCHRCTRRARNPNGFNFPQTFQEIDLNDLAWLSSVIFLLVTFGTQIWGLYLQRQMEKRYEPVIEVLDELAKALGTNVRFRDGRSQFPNVTAWRELGAVVTTSAVLFDRSTSAVTPHSTTAGVTKPTHSSTEPVPEVAMIIDAPVPWRAPVTWMIAI